MEKIRLANGAEYDITLFGANNISLSFTISEGKDVKSVASIFGDKKKTSQITYIHDTSETVYENDMELYLVQKTSSGFWIMYMKGL